MPQPERARGNHRRDPSVRLSDLSAEDLYEHAPCGYLSTTPDGRIVRVNATFLRWTGYTSADLVGVKRFQDLLTPGGRIYHETHYAPLLRMQGSVREIAVDIVAADGRRLPVLVNSVLAADGDIVRTTLLDARERRAYERELQAARDREREARERIERLHEQTRRISHTLQQSMLSGAPPDDPRYAISVLYRPAGEQLDVGGDWHDAFHLPGGRVAVVVGDVVGRGLSAATAMGQLRSAVRALAMAGVGPEAVIRHLDAFVAQAEPAQYATVVYVEIDPETGAATLTAAGHLPPVLLAPGRSPELYFGGRTTPLGVITEALPRTQQDFTLPPGGRILLYTDGLVERRGESLDVGLDRLLAAAAEDPSPEALVEALGGDGEDDVCVLGFARSGGE